MTSNSETAGIRSLAGADDFKAVYSIRNLLKFEAEFLRFPGTVGAVAPSSPALAHVILEQIRFGQSAMIVEFGPGTGAFTRLIRRRLKSGDHYLGIEINARFCRHVEQAFPTLEFVQGSVEHVPDVLAERGHPDATGIVCGLPWASFSDDLQRRLLSGLQRSLAPNGVFVTFAYLQGLALPGAWTLRRRLKEQFESVTTSPVVWLNLFPAFVYICRGARKQPG